MSFPWTLAMGRVFLEGVVLEILWLPKLVLYPN